MTETGQQHFLEIGVPVPTVSPEGFHTSTRLLDGELLLTSWCQGRATTRVGVLELATGRWRVLKGVRGMLRGAVRVRGDRVLMLSEYGLFEVDLDALAVIRKLTAGIGRHNDDLRLDDDGLVAVGHRERATESLVSLDTLEVVRRRRRGPLGSPTLTPTLARAGFVRLLSREAGLLVGATSAYPVQPQEIVVLAADDHAAVARVPARWGAESVHVWRDGLIVAPPDLARAGALLALPGLLDAPASLEPLAAATAVGRGPRLTP
ncbi:hypothetical protein ACLM5J_11280 [Nocardioides sp. Bht2]|uniref:hypothetical protein n=1 Tax=Nocardioides sp. Bht2 TaxID=3392297 RepID=UPI0039B5BD7A